MNITLEETLKMMEERDTRDSTRSVAPLMAAKDAVELDNSDMTVDVAFNAAMEIIKEKTGITV